MNHFNFDYFEIASRFGGVIYFCAFLLGAAAIYVTRKRKTRIGRELFFLNTTIIGGCAVLLSSVWIDLSALMEQNLVGVTFLATLFGFVSLGAWLAVAAVARSNDAFNSYRWALIAFIPLANIYLLFAPTRDRDGAVLKKKLSLHWISTGVIILTLSGFGGRFVEERVGRELEMMESDETAQADVLEWQIRRVGLERALALLAEQHDESRRIDPITELRAIHSNGEVLIRDFYVLRDDVELPGTFSERVRNVLCRSVLFQPIFFQGGVVRDRYQTLSGVELVTVEASTTECDDGAVEAQAQE